MLIQSQPNAFKRQPNPSNLEGCTPITDIGVIKKHKFYRDSHTGKVQRVTGVIRLEDRSLCPIVPSTKECHVVRRFGLNQKGELVTEWLGVGVFDQYNFSTLRDSIRSYNQIRENAARLYPSMARTFRSRKIVDMGEI